MYTFFEQTIIENIDLESYDLSNDVYLYDKIKTLYNIFKMEYGWNIERMGERRAFCEWLQGLPSALTVPFYNHDILNRAYLHNVINANATEEQEDKFIDNYFMNLSNAFFTLKNNL
jgi:hypothetical protein